MGGGRKREPKELKIITNSDLTSDEFGWWSALVNDYYKIDIVIYDGVNKDYLMSIIKRHVREVVYRVELVLVKKYNKA